jgi:hypothetical protein
VLFSIAAVWLVAVFVELFIFVVLWRGGAEGCASRPRHVGAVRSKSRSW